MADNKTLIEQCEAKAKQWLSPSFDEKTRADVQAMLDNADKTDLIESFYKDLAPEVCAASWELAPTV